MASLHERPDETWQVRFGNRVNGRDKRKRINFNKLSRRDALIAKRHVEELVECQSLAMPPSRQTREWLDGLSDTHHKRIAKKGLCNSRDCRDTQTIAGLCSHFLDWKKNRSADASIQVYERSTRMIRAYFSESRDISTIAPAAIDDFLRWIYAKGKIIDGEYGAPLAPTTASSRCRTVKSIFRRATRKRLIAAADFLDMFEDMPRQTRTNPERQRWVDADVVREVIKHAKSNEQRLIFALGRWGGIRMPSELLQIMWGCVDREAEKIRILSPKQRNTPIRRTR